METKHTPGPWELDSPEDAHVASEDYHTIRAGCGFLATAKDQREPGFRISGHMTTADACLITAAPELLEALRDTVDLAWIEDSHCVSFDSTVLFGPHYDFENLNRASRQEFHGQYECVVWPGAKWSAYCTYEGSMWFEQFDSADEAKEACMRLLDRVIPCHPAMKARAAIAKATGSAA
jgi:hypothetical protein